MDRFVSPGHRGTEATVRIGGRIADPARTPGGRSCREPAGGLRRPARRDDAADLPGAGAGATVGTGAGVGALIDKDNRWRGAAHGAALGGVLGGSVTEISSRAARESVSANQPVAYQSTDGWQRIEAVPQTRNTRGCRQVHERVYQDNRLVREQIREVC